MESERRRGKREEEKRERKKEQYRGKQKTRDYQKRKEVNSPKFPSPPFLSLSLYAICIVFMLLTD